MNHPILVSISTILTAGLLALGASSLAVGDDDDHDEHDDWLSRSDVAPATNATYRDECGACHMAYQPGLLPASAWERIMSEPALIDHYGDDASLSEPLRAEISGYLTDHAADHASRSRSRAFAVPSGEPGQELPRITATRYFRSEHHEIPARWVTGNPDVGSFSQCNACHRRADDGDYNEHRVVIPGVGRWDD